MTTARISSYRDLNVWQAAMHLAEDAYRVASGLPGKEAFGLVQQIQCAAVELAARLKYLSSSDFETVRNSAVTTGKMLRALQRAIKTRVRARS